MQTGLTAKIQATMDQRGESLRSLAIKANIPRITLSRRMEHPGDFTMSELGRLFDALGIKSSTVNVRDAA